MKILTYFLLPALLASSDFSLLKAQDYTFQVVECGTDTIFPAAMNTRGTVVGGLGAAGSNNSLGFVYSNRLCRIVQPTVGGLSLTGIADNGDVVGIYGTTSTNLFILDGGVARSLPLYPHVDASWYCCLDKTTGVLAGNYEVVGSVAQYGFFYKNGKFTRLPSPGNSALTISAINGKGTLVGTVDGASLYGFIYIDGKVQTFQYPGAKYTTFNGINNKGLIVGTYVSTGKFGVCSYDTETKTWKDLQFGVYASAVPIGVTDSGVIAARVGVDAGLVIATPTN